MSPVSRHNNTIRGFKCKENVVCVIHTLCYWDIKLCVCVCVCVSVCVCVCVVYSSGTAARLKGFSDWTLFEQFCAVLLREHSRDLLLASLTTNPQTVTESSTMYYSLTQKSAWDVFCPGGKKNKGRTIYWWYYQYTGHFFVVFVNINVGLLVFIFMF